MTTERDFQRSFGRRMAEVRKSKALTQERLAEIVEVHRTYIGFIEQGKRNPSVGNVHKIAKALGISLHELFRPF